MQWRKFTRLKTATGNSRTRRMLCCGRRKENGRSVPDLTASPGRAPSAPMPTNQNAAINQRQISVKEPVLLQGDFRKVSGISSEIFRQIEAVENDHDSSTAAALEAVERRGEMIVRVLEARCIGGRQAVESAQKLLSKGDARHSVQLVEIVKRPGQTLGLYIREGNGADRSDGVFISRIALESAVYNSGCLRVGDEILAVNLVDVTHMSLDDVVIIMSIPRRLVLAIRQRRGARSGSPGPTLSRNEQKPPPVVVIKRELRDEDTDELDRSTRSRSARERRTGDGREMTESRSRLGLGLNNYSPQSENLDLYYSSRQNMINEPNWSYKPPPPPSVITEQPKSHTFAPSHAYYQNAGTLESLAEKVHAFYPGPNRRMSTGTGMGSSQSHIRFPRSGSDQHLPRVDYSDFSSLNRHSLLRSSLKAGMNPPGGTLGRYGRYETQPSTRSKFGPSPTQVALRRARPTLDYSSDTEATIPPPRSSYYYRPTMNSIPRGGAATLAAVPDLAKFNSLPRERPGARLGLRPRLTERLGDESDGNISAPELPAQVRDLRNRMVAPSPSIFTSDEYRAWLRRAPSSSAIYEQMRTSRDILNQQRAHRFSCSAENIHDALKNTESIYSSRTGGLTNTLDRHIGGSRPITAAPIRSLSTQHIGSGLPLRSPSIRRMRQLLELSGTPASPGSVISGHQSPAPTPTRSHRQIDINPAEFSKYKLEKPVLDIGGVSGMIWIHLLAGRGLRMTPEGSQMTPQNTIRDLYCVLECDRVHKARTVVRSGDLQSVFDWDESFELDLVSNKQLDVLVYSWDPQHRHKLCYRGAVSLSTLLRQSPLHQLALKVEPRGTIYLRLRYTDPHTLYRRRGLPSLRAGYPQLFGADLEAVVTREAKMIPGQAPVPIVLRRCVEEIERRGLDIIGLYRLCGSATKKRLLREAFERNCRAVELTPDHVPDINVITGVLKDYLRELPEPLFTRCLFQMTVDALGVCLPDDPEGNAKLMLSILDCLPRANRATLVFLLDHLSLVVSASERNKMSAQALATVIGPPLMLHSANSPNGSEVDHAQPIAVLKYLLQIWPQPQTANISGHRNEPQEQRGNKVSVLPAEKLRHNQHIMGSTLVEQHLPSATHSTRPYQSAVAQSAQSLRVSQRLHQSAGKESVDSMALDPSQQPQLATPSPESSSTSTNSGSGSSKSADTVKRGISPTFLTSSLSSSKIRDSNSSFAINTSNNLDGVADKKESYTRGKNTNTTSSKNVLFATDADKSPSSFASNELTNFINLNAIQPTSTSTLIKQTLSPLVHHRKPNNASNILNESKNAANQLKTKLKTGSTSIKNYHLSSNTFVMDNNDDDGGSGGGIHDDNDDRSNFLLSASTNTSNTTIKKTLSPSKSLINHTNMLPSQVARSNNIQYQFESNCLPKNKANNIASPGSTLFNALSSISASNAPVTLSSQTSIAIPASTTATISNNSYPSNNIYGTLPKTTNPSSSGTVYGNVTAVANEFEQLIARNACNNTITNTTTNHTNYHTLGSYRIQYSSTNPFLNNFNSKSSE